MNALSILIYSVKPNQLCWALQLIADIAENVTIGLDLIVIAEPRDLISLVR